MTSACLIYLSVVVLLRVPWTSYTADLVYRGPSGTVGRPRRQPGSDVGLVNVPGTDPVVGRD